MDVIKKVRDLMRLAADQEGLPEGDLAAKMARKLMHTHAISMHQLKMTGEPPEDLVEHEHLLKKTTTWRQLLLDAVCDHCDCQMIFYKGTNIHRIFGYRTNVDLAMYLYDVIEHQLTRRSQEFYREELTPKIKDEEITRQEARGRRIDFLVTAIYALRDRFKKMRVDQSAEDPKGTALVKYRFNEVDEFFKKMVGDVDEHQCYSRQYNKRGYAAGWDVTVSKGALDNGQAKSKGALSSSNSSKPKTKGTAKKKRT